MTLDVRLIAIADPDVLAGRDLVAAARDAARGGATAIQLRLKGRSAAGYVELAAELVRGVDVPVFVNDRADVAWAAGAHGVHLGADDLPPGPIRRLAPRPFLIGVSVGDEREAAAVRDADVDYWSLGSVFATMTKPDAGPPIGLAGFRALAAGAPAGMPVIGIGGIDAGNAPSVIRAGGNGVAVIRAIFGAADIEQATRALRDAVDGAAH